MKPIIQISMDVVSTAEALDIAELSVNAGVDWLEAGTPLVLAEGLHAVTELKKKFPDVPVVADLKIMDGGYQETELAAEAGADMVVVMARAPLATVRACVRGGREFGIKIMGDVLLGDGISPHDPITNAKILEEEGVDYIVLHTSYDARHEKAMDPMEHVAMIVEAVSLPVQVVGGLSLDQMVECVQLGAPFVVVGAPLVVDDERFAAADELDQLDLVLRELVKQVKGA